MKNSFLPFCGRDHLFRFSAWSMLLIIWTASSSPSSSRMWESWPSFPKSGFQDDKLIQVWYGPVQHFGRRGQPQRWINVLGTVSRPEAVQSVYYSLNNGPERPLTLGGDLHRLARPGDFNVELSWEEVQTGDNTLRLIARRKKGPPVTETVRLMIEKGHTWPIPYHIDFSEVDRLQQVVQIVDGHWRLEEDGVRTVEPYYDRVLCMGDSTWTHYEAAIRLTIHDYTPPEPGPPTYNVTHFGVAMRWRGHHTDDRQPNRKWYPLGAQGEFLVKNELDSCHWRILFDGGNKEKQPVYSSRQNTLVLGRPIRIRTQVTTLPDGRSRYRYKQWPDGQREPAGWDVEGLEKNDYPSGALCLVPHNTDVTIHEVQVEALPAPEE